MDISPTTSGASDGIGQPPLAYSVADAVRVTGLGRTTLYGLMDAGRLASTKIGNRRLIPHRALAALIDAPNA